MVVILISLALLANDIGSSQMIKQTNLGSNILEMNADQYELLTCQWIFIHTSDKHEEDSESKIIPTHEERSCQVRCTLSCFGVEGANPRESE